MNDFGPFSDYNGVNSLYDPENSVTYDSLLDTIRQMPTPPDHPPVYVSHQVYMFLKKSIHKKMNHGMVPNMDGTEIRIDPALAGMTWRNETQKEKVLRLGFNKYTDDGFDINSPIKTWEQNAMEHYRKRAGETYDEYNQRTLGNYTKYPWQY